MAINILESWKIQSKVEGIMLTAGSSVTLCPQAKGSALEDSGVCAGNLKELETTPKGNGEDYSSSKEAKERIPSFPFYSVQAQGLLVGATHILGLCQSSTDYPELCPMNLLGVS